MSKLSPARWCAMALIAALSGCAATTVGDAARMNNEQMNQLAALGTRQFDIRWAGPLSGANERGVMAVTDGATTLTARSGTRVFIVHNRKEFPPSEQMAFGGTDDELKRIGMKVLQASGVATEEIAELRVLQQFTQLGEAVRGGKDMRMMPMKNSHRSLLVTRRVAGVEVVSSRLLLNVDKAGRIGFMELGWPDIDRETLARAQRYRDVLERKPAVPPLEGAEVESVDVVVLHSPAVGFYNDSTTAIRIIYQPNAKQVGQKAVRYVDERGDDVKLPRDVDGLREDSLRRTEPRK